MTDSNSDRARQRGIRERQQETGESFNGARRRVLAEKGMREQIAQLTPEEMTALFNDGARAYTGHRASTHLLTYTPLMGHTYFAPHVKLVPVIDPDEDRPMTGAFVRDWGALVEDPKIGRLGGHVIDMVRLAAAFHGVPIDLGEHTGNYGHAHARRAAEAMLIAMGYEEFYHLAEGPGLTRLNELHRSLGIR